MKQVSYSINLHDKEGNKYGDCILIHVNQDAILRFEDMREYNQFIESLQIIGDEIDDLSSQTHSI